MILISFLINKLEQLINSYNIYNNNNTNIKQLSVIFDIDNTLLLEDGSPVKECVDFYHYCLRKGVTVFIVTARSSKQSHINYTISQLKNNTIDNFESIYFRPPDVTDIFNYKFLCRKNIYDKGYQTLISIGDQLTDIGEYGGIGVLLKYD